MKLAKNPYSNSADFTSKYEGWSGVAYQKKGDVPTIGYGTTNPKWVKKGRITKAQGRQAMMEDFEANEGLLRTKINGYDAMPESAKTVLRDILYNVGQGNMFRKSPKFIAALNAGDWEGAAAQMDWDNNKKGFSGARKRNKARQELFLSELGKRVLPKVPQTAEPQQYPPSYEPSYHLSTPVINTDYSLTNTPIQNPKSGIMNAWYGAGSPSYGGYEFRQLSPMDFLNTISILRPVI